MRSLLTGIAIGLALYTGCGAASRSSYGYGGGGGSAGEMAESDYGGASPDRSYSGDSPSSDEEMSGLAYGVRGPASVAASPPAEPAGYPAGESSVAAQFRSEPQAQLAQADTRASATTTTGTTAQAQAQATATDAVDTSGPLLIYVATFHLAVYEVAESQARIIAAVRELGGFVFAQSDDRIVVRVPAARFDQMLGQVEQAGDVEHRDVQAQDVSEEFHDVEIRIRNLEAMRTRVEALLAQARTVEDALQVEAQLQRITQELELMRGRQRFLADRISFSTITVLFRPRPRESLDQPEVFELPFGWLDNLGLSTLLDLR